MSRDPRLPCLLLTALLLAGCGGPSGACTGRVGASPVDGELGGETRLTLEGDSPRLAQLVLDYDDVRMDLEVLLPEGQASTPVPFGPGEPPPPAGLGQVTRFAITRPLNAAPLSEGTLTVQLDPERHLLGVLNVDLLDGSNLVCNFDVEAEDDGG